MQVAHLRNNVSGYLQPSLPATTSSLRPLLPACIMSSLLRVNTAREGCGLGAPEGIAFFGSMEDNQHWSVCLRKDMLISNPDDIDCASGLILPPASADVLEVCASRRSHQNSIFGQYSQVTRVFYSERHVVSPHMLQQVLPVQCHFLGNAITN